MGAAALARWVRIAGPGGRPVDALTARDFPAFEDALARLSQRGLIVRGGGRSGPGTSPDASRDRGPSNPVEISAAIWAKENYHPVYALDLTTRLFNWVDFRGKRVSPTAILRRTIQLLRI